MSRVTITIPMNLQVGFRVKGGVKGFRTSAVWTESSGCRVQRAGLMVQGSALDPGICSWTRTVTAD